MIGHLVGCYSETGRVSCCITSFLPLMVLHALMTLTESFTASDFILFLRCLLASILYNKEVLHHILHEYPWVNGFFFPLSMLWPVNIICFCCSVGFLCLTDGSPYMACFCHGDPSLISSVLQCSRFILECLCPRLDPKIPTMEPRSECLGFSWKKKCLQFRVC